MTSRKFLISEAAIDSMIKELNHIKPNCVSTPDMEASFNHITKILKGLKGEQK